MPEVMPKGLEIILTLETPIYVFAKCLDCEGKGCVECGKKGAAVVKMPLSELLNIVSEGLESQTPQEC